MKTRIIYRRRFYRSITLISMNIVRRYINRILKNQVNKMVIIAISRLKVSGPLINNPNCPSFKINSPPISKKSIPTLLLTRKKSLFNKNETIFKLDSLKTSSVRIKLTNSCKLKYNNVGLLCPNFLNKFLTSSEKKSM